ncbi:MAG: hypothetical protein LBR26_09715 [Prevotella sp.]|jgi:hypothetical protein|nr:hypothetical protein [Prevotella sp.]
MEGNPLYWILKVFALVIVAAIFTVMVLKKTKKHVENTETRNAFDLIHEGFLLAIGSAILTGILKLLDAAKPDVENTEILHKIEIAIKSAIEKITGPIPVIPDQVLTVIILLLLVMFFVIAILCVKSFITSYYNNPSAKDRMKSFFVMCLVYLVLLVVAVPLLSGTRMIVQNFIDVVKSFKENKVYFWATALLLLGTVALLRFLINTAEKEICKIFVSFFVLPLYFVLFFILNPQKGDNFYMLLTASLGVAMPAVLISMEIFAAVFMKYLNDRKWQDFLLWSFVNLCFCRVFVLPCASIIKHYIDVGEDQGFYPYRVFLVIFISLLILSLVKYLLQQYKNSKEEEHPFAWVYYLGAIILLVEGFCINIDPWTPSL